MWQRLVAGCPFKTLGSSQLLVRREQRMSHAVHKRSTTPFLIAGVCAGVAGLVTFLIIHHLWIQPIWFIAPVGLVIACLGGLAVGWSYAEIYDTLPSRPWTTLAVIAIITVVLAPSILLAQLRAPLIDVATFSIPPQSGSRAAAHVVFELVVTAVIAGATIGWLLGHTRQAACATALAGLVYAVGPGHNIPLLGNTPATGKGIVLLFAITFVSAFVLVAVGAGLLKRTEQLSSG